MLYVGRNYTAKVSGSVIKGVACENCGCEYIYKFTREAQGVGTSPYFLDNDGAQRRSQQAAANALIKALKGIDAVPCPDCGWYQQIMVVKLREKFSWLLYTGITGMVVSLITFLIGLEPFLYTAVPTVFVMSLWWILRSTFNPNTCAESRVGNPVKGVPEAVLRSILEPKLPDLEDKARASLEGAFAQIDEAKQKNAGKFQKAPMDPQAQARAETDRANRRRLQLGGLLVSGVAAFFAIGPIVHWQDEAAAYKKATLFRTNVNNMDRYLAEYPTGPHAQEITDLRDDVNFQNASLSATQGKFVGPLKAYLGDARNKRHRDEAKQLCRKIYQDAIAQLENLRRTKEFDADLAAGLAAAMKAQADSENPTITVNITCHYQAEPATAAVRETEELSKSELLNENPELKTLAANNAKGNRIVPVGDLFGKPCELQRNAIIIQRLQMLVELATGARVVTLVPVPKAEQGAPSAPAMINIDYAASPSGYLHVYTTTLKPQYTMNGRPLPGLTPPAPASGTKTLKGFVRVYQVDWSISFNVQNFQQKGPVVLQSVPLNDIKFVNYSKDNDWGIYAAMLHSASLTAYQALARKLGLPEQTISNSFSPDGPA
jgi:hypothetical protein